MSMTVDELIGKLKEYPGDAQIQVTMVRTCDCGTKVSDTDGDFKVQAYYYFVNEFWVQILATSDGQWSKHREKKRKVEK